MITAEIKRVLKKTGSLWWNMGDTYAGSSCGSSQTTNPDHWGKQKRKGLSPAEALFSRNPPQKDTNLPSKCLMGIPWRFVLRLVDEQGFILRNCIIWYKVNAMPSSVKDRLANKYEYLFHLVKNTEPEYYWNEKTGLMADRKPSKDKQKEGIDWDWKDIGEDYSQSDTKIEIENAEKMNSPRARVYRNKKQKKVSYWHSLGYWYDLDAIREPQKYPEDVLRRMRQDKKAGVKPFKKGTMESRHSLVEMARYDEKGQIELRETEKIAIKYGYDPEGICPVCGRTWKRHASPNSKDRKSGLRREFIPCTRGPEYKGKWKDNQEYMNKLSQRINDVRASGIPHDLALADSRGKNPGDCWSINTQPFPEAHFATFPLELCRRPILATCPLEICKKCEKARVRIVERKYTPRGTDDKPRALEEERKGNKDIAIVARHGVGWTHHQIIGWTDCDCPDDGDKYRAGIVLDPFAGAGTALVVAKKLGRNFIGYELVKNYIEMARKRLEKAVYQKEFEL